MRQINFEKLAGQNIIEEIYLFGSVARGEDDQFSDVDILIIVQDCTEEEYIELKDYYAKILDIPVEWISLYRISKVEKMYNRGSYFLWHIKKEGIKLYSKTDWLEILLKTLPQYKDMEKDLQEYCDILKDIDLELQNEYIDSNYELSVLASLVRNTCIVLSYMNNRFDFGRESVIITCKDIYKKQILFSLDEYIELYKYRLFETGKLNTLEKGSIELIKKWIYYERKLLKMALKGVKVYVRQNKC